MCNLETCSHAGGTEHEAGRGSRRRRIWELKSACHCPVIGVCLSIATLRKLAGRLFREQDADDYGVHVSAVSQCASRTPLAELIQSALDRQHDITVQRFRRVRSREELYQLWRQAVAEGRVAGPLWAALSHPTCDAHLEELICREIHMVQHQAGALERLDRSAFAQLQKEHAVLVGELARAQQRSTQLLAEKAQAMTQLEAQHMRLRCELVKRDSTIAFLRADLEEVRSQLQDTTRLERMEGLNAELNRLLRQRDERIASLQGLLARQAQERRPRGARETEAPLLETPAGAQARAHEQGQEHADEQAAARSLEKKTVLCVGGRASSLEHYRNIVEQEGGRFSHHHGGNDQRADALDSDLAAADLVICQTGCISHHAYWRVKDFCKRTGKTCVFLDNPSTSSFTRGLRHILLRQVPGQPEPRQCTALEP